MKPLAEYVVLGLLTVGGAGLTISSCSASGCTPQERQAVRTGVIVGDAACVAIARCAGVPDVADYCHITADVLKQIDSALPDPSCPLPQDAGAHE